MYNDTNTITLNGENITTTRHGEGDYSIAFEYDDFSVRGQMLDVVQTFAEWQSSNMGEPAVSFPWKDRTISNPWLDESARFPLDSVQASELYGVDNVLRFVSDACDLLRGY